MDVFILVITNYDPDRSPRFGELIAFDRAWVVLDIFYLPPSFSPVFELFPLPLLLVCLQLVLSPMVR